MRAPSPALQQLTEMSRLAFSIFIVPICLASCADSGPRGVVFKKADYGEKWPFSVDEIDVFCAGLAGNEIYFQADDQVYALNGKAQTAGANKKSTETFKTFKEVWLDDPKYPGTKVIVPSEFIDQALINCSQ